MNDTGTASTYILKLIVLDDDPVVRAMIGKMLSVDYEIQQAATYREFREKLLTFTPDVALIDLLLPDGDGIEICSELRRERGDGNLFIYILTANRDESSIEKAYRAGANDYLIKPFNRLELKSKIAQCSRMMRSHDELTRSLKQQSRLKKRLFNLNRLVKNSIQVSDYANLFSEIEQILSVIPSRYLEVVTLPDSNGFATVLSRDDGNSGMIIPFLKIYPNLADKISRSQPSYLQLQPGSGEPLHCALVPYHVSGKTAGYILLERERKFSNDEKNILSLFGDFFGIMHERINIQAQVERQNSRYRDEISKVRTVEVSLLPRFSELRGFDMASTFLPADDLSGDFFDGFFIEEDVYQVVLCDISGHGIASSYVGNAFRTLLRSYSTSENDPAKVLHEVNARMVADARGLYYFGTILLVRIQVSTGHVTFASGGHPPALLYEKTSGNCRDLGNTGPLVGIFDSVAYKNTSFTMDEGDCLFMYTDGLVEAMAENSREMYGEDRLRQNFLQYVNESSIDIVHSIVGSFYEYTSYSWQEDDLTIICIKKT